MTTLATARKRKQENPYEDRIEGDVLIYTATGKTGDQLLVGKNKRLLEQYAKPIVSDTRRALPPAEHHVVVAWHKTPAHRDWFLKHHLAVVRLGRRRGSFKVLPELASVRHVLFRADDNFVEACSV